MMRGILTFGLSWIAFLCVTGRVLGGGLVTVVQTQTQSTAANGGLVATNWTAGTNGVNDPLVFTKFDSTLGQLTSISISMTTTIRNDYEMVFPQTSTPTTIYLATSQTSDPSVLADPAKRALLTDGPSVTLTGPNGSTLFGSAGTRQPVDFVSLTKSQGTYSSLLPISSPFFIQPTVTTQTFERTLTPTDSLFNAFIGTGSLDLPVGATAFSSFYSSTGNGGGAVLTDANASVSIQFTFLAAPQPQQITPEPSSILLLGVGGVLVLLAARRWRRTESLA